MLATYLSALFGLPTRNSDHDDFAEAVRRLQGNRECPDWVVDFILENQVYTFRFMVIMLLCWIFWIPYFLIRTWYLVNVRMR